MRHPHHVDAMPDRWQRAQPGRHGCEGESSVRTERAREVQRTLARMIAGKKERLASLIPAGEGEAANQMIDNVEAPPHPGVGEALRHRKLFAEARARAPARRGCRAAGRRQSQRRSADRGGCDRGRLGSRRSDSRWNRELRQRLPAGWWQANPDIAPSMRRQFSGRAGAPEDRKAGNGSHTASKLSRHPAMCSLRAKCSVPAKHETMLPRETLGLGGARSRRTRLD